MSSVLDVLVDDLERPRVFPSVVVVLYVVKFMKYQYLWNRSLDFKNSKSFEMLVKIEASS